MNSTQHDYNYILGTQTIGVVYQFTEKTRLVETAEGILGMGSNLLKICMGRSYSQGHYSLPENEDIRSLKDLATLEPSFRHVLEMPFSIYHLWVYPFSSGPWQNGFSAEEQVQEYREIYELAAYLMKRFHGTGKTFFFGHWEGDWYLHPGYKAEMDPDPALIKNMILWLQVRQKAVDEARRDHHDSDVRIYHYTEANLVQKAMQGKSCLVNDVLPNVPVDFVSYSSYDTIIPHRENVRQPLFDALEFIDAKLPRKTGITGRRVFIGEYGFPLELTGTPEEQDRFARGVCRAALEWGCPFALYWEFYCNEIKEGRHRGFWLINDQNEKQPFYFTLHSFYENARALVDRLARESGRGPAQEEYTAIALTWLK